MKLLRCNIVNYGCLHDFSYEFQPGINQINQPNSWGKSTFASFLCAMLYGLDSTTKRNIRDNERKHYQPWQGGVFGGSLDFEISGRQYRVERFFGLRERQDTFSLYDLKTMQPSRDYSPQLGIELFGIDKTGYLHSTHIPQGKTALEYNDTLAARLTRLSQSPDDINRFEQAIDEIDKAMRFYVKTGKRGEIAHLEQMADITAQSLQDALYANKQLAEFVSRQVCLEKQKEHLDRQLTDIQQQIAQCTDQEIQARYHLLDTHFTEKEKELNEMEEFFHDMLPDEQDIELYIQSCVRLSQSKQLQQQEALNSLQMQEFNFLKIFFASDDIISHDSEKVISDAAESIDEETVFTDNQQNLLMQSEQYQAEAALLFSSDQTSQASGTYPFSEDLPDSHTVNDARQLYYRYRSHLSAQKEDCRLSASVAEQLKQTQASLEQEEQAASESRTNTEKKGVHSQSNLFHQLPILLIFLAAGLLTGYLITPVIGLIIAFSGVIVTVFLILRPQKATDIQSEIKLQTHIKTCTRLKEQITQLQSQYDVYKQKETVSRLAAEEEHKQLLVISEQLHIPLEDSDVLTDNYLSRLAQLDNQLNNYQQEQLRQYNLYKKQLAFYKHLEQKYKDYIIRFQLQSSREQQISDMRQDITRYLHSYFPVSETETCSNLDRKLHELKAKLISYRQLLSEMRLASQNLNNFFQEHPDFQKSESPLFSKSCAVFQKSDGSAGSKSLTALQEEQFSIRNQYTDCIQQISDLQALIQQTQEKADKYHTLEEKKTELEQKISKYKERYHILSLTKQYLTQARHDFTNNYLYSIEKNFKHYAHILQRNELMNADMNSDFHIVVSDSGILRETGWYSQGTRDLIDLCSRLSVIEDLFSDEPPFLVLDDPFVNLDDNSLKCLSSILHDIADRWQIIYFTCHSSREIQ